MGCNCKKDKKEFIRIVKNKNGKISLDKTLKMDGRGAYLCENEVCLEKIKKNKKIEKSLKINIKDEFYEELRRAIIQQTK